MSTTYEHEEMRDACVRGGRSFAVCGACLDVQLVFSF